MRPKLVFYALVVSLQLMFVASAQSQQGHEDDKFRQTFNNLNLDARLYLQELLVASGALVAVPTEEYSRGIFEGFKKFQLESGVGKVGEWDKSSFEKLAAAANSFFETWKFQPIRHPIRDYSIWIPLGLGLDASKSEYGLTYADPKKKVTIDFTTIPEASIERTYNAFVSAVPRDNGIIHYSLRKDGWFAISFAMADGVHGYARYHQDGPYVTGFSLYWDNRNGDVYGDRLALLMSASLRASIAGAPMIPPASRAPAAGSTPAAPSTLKESGHNSGGSAADEAGDGVSSKPYSDAQAAGQAAAQEQAPAVSWLSAGRGAALAALLAAAIAGALWLRIRRGRQAAKPSIPVGAGDISSSLKDVVSTGDSDFSPLATAPAVEKEKLSLEEWPLPKTQESDRHAFPFPLSLVSVFPNPEAEESNYPLVPLKGVQEEIPNSGRLPDYEAYDADSDRAFKAVCRAIRTYVREHPRIRSGIDVYYDRPTVLYYVRLQKGEHKAYKIGITTYRNVYRRFSDEPVNCKVIRAWKYKTGAPAYSIEQAILCAFSFDKYTGPNVLAGSGNSELFDKDILELDDDEEITPRAAYAENNGAAFGRKAIPEGRIGA